MNINIHTSGINEGKLVAIAVVGVLCALILFFILISEGIVRHVPVTMKEKIETTVAFKMIDGKLNVVGIVGNSGTNPTLLMRTRDFAMVLTVINKDKIYRWFGRPYQNSKSWRKSNNYFLLTDGRNIQLL